MFESNEFNCLFEYASLFCWCVIEHKHLKVLNMNVTLITSINAEIVIRTEEMIFGFDPICKLDTLEKTRFLLKLSVIFSHFVLSRLCIQEGQTYMVSGLTGEGIDIQCLGEPSK